MGAIASSSPGRCFTCASSTCRLHCTRCRLALGGSSSSCSSCSSSRSAQQAAKPAACRQRNAEIAGCLSQLHANVGRRCSVDRKCWARQKKSLLVSFFYVYFQTGGRHTCWPCPIQVLAAPFLPAPCSARCSASANVRCVGEVGSGGAGCCCCMAGAGTMPRQSNATML